MTTSSKKYIEAIGRRKTSVARVRISEDGKAPFTVNERSIESYFPTALLRRTVYEPLKLTESTKKIGVSVHVDGGGVSSQAGAVRQGIARALTAWNADLRTPLKKAKLLTRDAREKERRKFGLKKARKSPQWSKR